MSNSTLLSLLGKHYPAHERYQRLIQELEKEFACGAIVLLKLDNQSLKPVLAQGLVEEAMGRRFIMAQHPRLAALVNSLSALRFPVGSTLPDPYDGLLTSQPGADLPIHDCMGTSLWVNNKCWGVLTLDSLTLGTFEGNSLTRLEELRPLLEANLQMADLEDEVKNLKHIRIEGQTLALPNNEPHEIIGKSPKILQIKKELGVVAGSDLPALLMGETGVGKEVFANFIHSNSNRASKPMVHINCAALPENLAESELFGHVKGAFTGANSDRSGRFESADQGTIFLDEVGELPLSVQAKLLRVLQNGELQRLGSDKVQYVDVRIIAATNRNFKTQISEGSFRADLYHRLSVYPITIPPLRERIEDIPRLSGYFLELNRSRLGVRSLRLSHDAEKALISYHWPGNVRELEHAISRAAIKALSRGAQQHEIITLTADLLDLDIPLDAIDQANVFESIESLHDWLEPVRGLTMKEAIKVLQSSLIQEELRQQSGSWSATARILGVDPSNLHKLAQKLGLK